LWQAQVNLPLPPLLNDRGSPDRQALPAAIAAHNAAKERLVRARAAAARRATCGTRRYGP